MRMDLLESRAKPVRRRGGIALSVVVHSALIGAAVVGTAAGATLTPHPAPPAPDTVVWLVPVPPSPAAAPAGGGHAGTAVAAVNPRRVWYDTRSIAIPATIAPSIDIAAATLVGDPLASVAPGATPTGSPSGGGVYRAHQVDREVMALPGSPAPRYPELLRQAGVEGEVMARFIVDTTGLVRPGSFQVLGSTQDLFAVAVRATLPDMRFIPARVGERKVPQLVEQRFTFEIR